MNGKGWGVEMETIPPSSNLIDIDSFFFVAKYLKIGN
jgi:hypothetical protein